MTGDVRTGLDWMELICTANEEFVSPALFRRLVRSGGASLVDEDALAYLRGLDEANGERNRRLWQLLRTVVGGLNRAGIVPLVIKGGSDLARRADPADVARILVDVDLLVTATELSEAERVLADLGFGLLENTRYEHSPGSYWRSGEVGPVDLHTALPERIATLLPAGALPRTVERERDGIRFLVPDASLHFLINISHEMLHDNALLDGTTKLRYLLDLAEQVEDPDTSLDWDWLAARRTNRRFRLALDLQRLMMKHLLAVDLDRIPDPGIDVRLLHRRRIIKLRRPRLGLLERRVLQRGLRLARHARMQASS